MARREVNTSERGGLCKVAVANRVHQRRCMCKLMHGKMATAQQRKRAAAKQLQSHGKFETIELKYWRLCSRTNGRVKYVPPPRGESTSEETKKRRKGMMDRLIPLMSKEDRRAQAALMQKHATFQRNERYLRRKCDETFGPYKVSYEGPSDTELYPQTRARRKRLRGKFIRFYFGTWRLIRKYRRSNRTITKVVLDCLRNDANTKTWESVPCRLGVHKCPCHGCHDVPNWWFRDTVWGYMLPADHLKTCAACNTLYNPKDAPFIETLFKICAARRARNLWWEDEDEERPFPYDDATTYFRIKWYLMPLIKKWFRDHRKDRSFPYLAMADKEIDAFVAREYSSTLAGLKLHLQKLQQQLAAVELDPQWPPEERTLLFDTRQEYFDAVQARTPREPVIVDLRDYGVGLGWAERDEEQMALMGGAPTREDILALKVAGLKKQLRAHGCRVKGLKKELQQRLAVAVGVSLE